MINTISKFAASTPKLGQGQAAPKLNRCGAGCACCKAPKGEAFNGDKFINSTPTIGRNTSTIGKPKPHSALPPGIQINPPAEAGQFKLPEGVAVLPKLPWGKPGFAQRPADENGPIKLPGAGRPESFRPTWRGCDE